MSNLFNVTLRVGSILHNLFQWFWFNVQSSTLIFYSFLAVFCFKLKYSAHIFIILTCSLDIFLLKLLMFALKFNKSTIIGYDILVGVFILNCFCIGFCHDLCNLALKCYIFVESITKCMLFNSTFHKHVWLFWSVLMILFV